MQAKITGPSLSGVVRRERLFQLLDEKMEKPLVWISSPAGAGKTTLVASYLESRKFSCIWYQCDAGDADLPTFFYYLGLSLKKASPRRIKPLPSLTPEYLAGIQTFTRRYFEILFSCLAGQTHRHQASSKHRVGVVLDNYQEVPVGSPFHAMIAAGCDVVPEGAHVVVISRSKPPPAFARLQANGKMGILRYPDVRFTLEESRELLLRRSATAGAETVNTIHSYTQGWAAGMILMLESANASCNAEETAEDRYDMVFDYFAGEIFDRSEKKVQAFLLKTAFLPILSAALAEKVTGDADAGQILRRFQQNNFFTEKLSGSGKDYHYHPLFRNFLLNRANRTFSSNELTAIQQHAGRLLEEEDQIEEAAGLYGRTGDGEGLARMVVRHARELLRQGRNKTLAEWIAAIPVDTFDQDPWLFYWSGMSFFPFDLPHARNRLEKAFAAFTAAGDLAGICLSWAGIVDTYAYELEAWERLDDLIAVFEDLSRRHHVWPSNEIDLIASSRMLIALTLRRTDKPQKVEQWLDRVTALLQANPSVDIEMDTAFCMSLYCLWKGEYHKNLLLLEKAETEVSYRDSPPFAVIRIKLMKGIHFWVTAEYDAALHILAEGLEASRESGMHVFDSLMWSFRAAAQMASGQIEAAATSMKRQMTSLLDQEKLLDVFFYHVNAAWHALLTGNPSLAAENLQAVSARVTEIGTPYYRALWNIGMAQTAFMQGHIDDAKSLVQGACRISLSIQSYVMEWYSLLIDAYFSLHDGKEEKARQSLRRGLGLGRQYGYAHLEFYQPSVMRLLCVKALEQGIEPEYVKGLIIKLGLAPPDVLNPASSGFCLENWPYFLKIYTLGRFEIKRDDETIVFARKVQKKPLELLKTVIAFGGRNVPESRVADALWPDADGDLAHKSLETTLSRLRRLLGKDDVLIYKAGQLSLNPRQCWVDSFALAHLLDTIEEDFTNRTALLRDQALDLYKGHFLVSDIGLTCALPCRETLRNRMLRVVLTAGRHYEQERKWEKAAELYRKGIETDPLAEECYRRLMESYRNLGCNADAARAYLRCRELLKAELGIAPSAETRAVYDQITQKN